MRNLLNIINEIIKYGINTNLEIKNKHKDLEKNLIAFYNISFDIKFTFDESEHPEFDTEQFPNVLENVNKNFPDFGLYHTVLNSSDINSEAEIAMEDSTDDLVDIIHDLIEIKWRIENNSKNDGLWFFELIFYSHTQQHLLNLLNYLKSKNG